MKLLSFYKDGKIRWGFVDGASNPTEVVDGMIATGGRISCVRDLLESGRVATLERLAQKIRPHHALDELRLAPPIPNPRKIFAIGVNYRDHAAEIDTVVAAAPVVFSRFDDCLIGHESFILRPRVSVQLDFEGELAVVIGRGGRYIAEADAMSHVAGYTCFNDVSLRDYQKQSITAGKNFLATGPIGPWISLVDEVPDPARLQLTTRLNGVVVQQCATNKLIHSIPALIAYISTFTPLSAGDVIATGTPSGIGARRTPPLWMRHGDRVEVDISDIGVLANTVHDESA